jgi:hypothetical protein
MAKNSKTANFQTHPSPNQSKRTPLPVPTAHRTAGHSGHPTAQNLHQTTTLDPLPIRAASQGLASTTTTREEIPECAHTPFEPVAGDLPPPRNPEAAIASAIREAQLSNCAASSCSPFAHGGEAGCFAEVAGAPFDRRRPVPPRSGSALDGVSDPQENAPRPEGPARQGSGRDDTNRPSSMGHANQGRPGPLSAGGADRIGPLSPHLFCPWETTCPAPRAPGRCC